jgi:hypothetical protein
MTRLTTALALSLAASLSLGACSKKQELTAPPAPLRPEPAPSAATNRPVQKDCPVTDHEPSPITFDERSIPESARLAEQARTELRAADSAEIDRSTREQYITDAVEHLITALAADPYNVSATYTLAAAYARIGRPQCSINLLTRLLQMRTHASKRDEVEKQLDRLLGRKQPLDPDFADMRADERFRTLIRKMCEGTNDPNCVFGASRR